MKAQPRKRGRPEAIPADARWKIRMCYRTHFGQWGPAVLRAWAIREKLGCWATGTIARIIADMKPKPQPSPKPKRYDITASMVMWSQDGTKFNRESTKRELLVVQDECGRYKLNWHLAERSASAAMVVKYLREAFEKYGAPLVLKHDGGSIFHEEAVKKLLDEYAVVDITSPPNYPQFNGKKERSMRDVKGYERALLQNGQGANLEERITLTMKDLNDDRPRPMLGGRTAAEVFAQDRIRLPDRRRFKMEVETKQAELVPPNPTQGDIQAARRSAVIHVLSHYGLLEWRGDMSTNSTPETGTH